MPRQPKPWRRDSKDGAWYAQIDRTQVRLAEASATKSEATAELHRLLASRARARRIAKGEELTVVDVFNLFLTHVDATVGRGELERVTQVGYERYLRPAMRSLGEGSRAAVDLRPHHVTAWLDARQKWGVTSRANAVTAVKRAFRWAARVGHLARSPLDGLARPAPRRREAILSTAQLSEILDAVKPDDPFHDLLIALRETGCRSKEVYGMTAARVDLARRIWIVPNKTARATGEAVRVVHLSDAAVEVSRRLAAAHPDGPLFRNTLGNAWTRWAVALRMGRLAARLGFRREAAVSGLRHGFITDALEAGVPPATVAALVGHKDLTMISRVYSHLSERHEHLAEAARRARPGGGPGPGPEGTRTAG